MDVTTSTQHQIMEFVAMLALERGAWTRHIPQPIKDSKLHNVSYNLHTGEQMFQYLLTENDIIGPKQW